MVFLFFFLLLSFFPVTYSLVFYGFFFFFFVVLFLFFAVVVVVVFLSFAFLFEENLCFSLFCTLFFLEKTCDCIFELFLYIILCEYSNLQIIFKLYANFEVQLVFSYICNYKLSDKANDEI